MKKTKIKYLQEILKIFRVIFMVLVFLGVIFLFYFVLDIILFGNTFAEAFRETGILLLYMGLMLLGILTGAVWLDMFNLEEFKSFKDKVIENLFLIITIISWSVVCFMIFILKITV